MREHRQEVVFPAISLGELDRLLPQLRFERAALGDLGLQRGRPFLDPFLELVARAAQLAIHQVALGDVGQDGAELNPG